jgi:quinol monooxygenase YgiN
METLTIVAHITAGADHIEVVRAALLDLIEPTRAERGCIRYDLHQDNAHPAHFMFFEQWDSRELWQAHMHSPHLQAYLAATDGMIDAFTLHEMTRIG